MTAPVFSLSRYGAAVFDLDGTVWLSEVPIAGAVDWLDRCRDERLTITFATNATTYSIPRITEQLQAQRIASPESRMAWLVDKGFARWSARWRG